ncbi:MAG: methionine--tRNA ligase [Candidatus Paceibacterota bacterium]
MEKKSFYLTTTLPYVNAEPHIGFALEIVQADVVARVKRLEGYDVFFNTGTDEHGLKIYKKAQEEGVGVQKYVDKYAKKFDDLKQALNLSYDAFIRTTDEHHLSATKEFWNRCLKSGDIYKKNYKIKYCVGCELEKTDSELVNGKCSMHPNRELEIIEEENYFFRFSKYQDVLLDLYKNNPEFVVPDFRFNEIKSFVKNGLMDFSISRLKEKMPWGVPVPEDENQVMFVWFDALINYISTLGWPEDKKKFEKFWPGIQFAGKDNLRQQSAMWQAMLLSASLPTTKQIMIHGFILTETGEKISKSAGNTGRITDPFYYFNEYGTDAVRYYLTRHVHPFEDTNFSAEKFKEGYNAGLANGLGNLVSRVVKMRINYNVDFDVSELKNIWESDSDSELKEYKNYFEKFEFNKALDLIWNRIGEMDKKIAETQPFKLIKTDEKKAKEIISELVFDLYKIAKLLEPVMPETAEKIQKIIEDKKMPEPLFLRKE